MQYYSNVSDTGNSSSIRSRSGTSLPGFSVSDHCLRSFSSELTDRNRCSDRGNPRFQQHRTTRLVLTRPRRASTSPRAHLRRLEFLYFGQSRSTSFSRLEALRSLFEFRHFSFPSSTYQSPELRPSLSRQPIPFSRPVWQGLLPLLLVRISFAFSSYQTSIPSTHLLF